MPVSAGKKQHKKQAKTQSSKRKGCLTHKEFKQKLFQKRPDVKQAYDALEPEYQREVAIIQQAIGKKNEAQAE